MSKLSLPQVGSTQILASPVIHGSTISRLCEPKVIDQFVTLRVPQPPKLGHQGQGYWEDMREHRPGDRLFAFRCRQRTSICEEIAGIQVTKHLAQTYASRNSCFLLVVCNFRQFRKNFIDARKEAIGILKREIITVNIEVYKFIKDTH